MPVRGTHTEVSDEGPECYICMELKTLGKSGVTDAPLCVDVDGTLIATDLLYESVMVLAKRKPWLLFLLPFWLLRGKAALKSRIAEQVRLNASSLPYRASFLEWLRAEKERGCQLYLVTGSDRQFAEAIAKHLNLFAGWMASDGIQNLTGSNKRDRLVREFGEGGFRYAGNASVDGVVWKHSCGAVVVGSDSVARMAGRSGSGLSHAGTATQAPPVMEHVPSFLGMREFHDEEYEVRLYRRQAN